MSTRIGKKALTARFASAHRLAPAKCSLWREGDWGTTPAIMAFHVWNELNVERRKPAAYILEWTMIECLDFIVSVRGLRHSTPSLACEKPPLPLPIPPENLLLEILRTKICFLAAIGADRLSCCDSHLEPRIVYRFSIGIDGIRSQISPIESLRGEACSAH